MSSILPRDLTNTEIKEIERFTKKYEIRVKLFRDGIATVYDSTPISSGDYIASTGIYTLSSEIWLKRVSFSSSSGYDVVQIEYEDLNGNWVVAKTYKPDSSDHSLKYSVYGKKFRFTEYKEFDPTDTTHPATPTIYAEEWHDISEYIGDSIKVENSSGNMLGSIKLPFVSLTLNNDNGRWHKKTTFSLKSNVETYASPYGSVVSSKTVPKQGGIKISVEIKFLGPDWEDKNWIVLAVFYARKWTSVAVSGESGWVAKTLYDTPIVEGATIDEIIDNYICRKEGDMLLQIVKDDEIDVITVSGEVIGEADLEPDIPTKLIEGTETHAFCKDDRHIYYSVKVAGSVANTFDGGYVEIRRMLLSGTGDEFVGRIYAVPQATVYYIGGGYDVDFDNNFYTANFSHINNNSPLKRMIRGCYGMAVDGEYLYITVSSVCNQVFETIATLEHVGWIGESLLYKLKKDGSGWASLVGPNVTINQTKHRLTEYTDTHVYSLGFRADMAEGVGTYLTYDYNDLLDVGNVWTPLFRNVIVFDDSGTEKLLYIKERNRNDTQNPTTIGSEFWLCNKDFSARVQEGNTLSEIRIEAIAEVSEIITYVHWSEWNSGTLQGKYLGILERDSGTGDFFIAEYGSAGLDEWFISMQFILDGLYATGNDFDNGIYDPNSEVVAPDGIKQKYQCIFQFSGFNIMHFQHATRNDFNSYHVPEVFIGGTPINYGTVRYASEYLSGELMVTTGWVLNLKTGEITLRQALPSDDPIEVIASYDFQRSVMFYEGKSKSRLDNGGLGKIAQASSRNYILNEAGMLERLKFIESQEIPLRHPVFDYDEVDEDLGEKQDGADYGIIISGAVDDRLTSFQFTPKFDGYVEAIRFPIKIIKHLTLDPVENSSKSCKIYITNESSGEIDYMSTDGNKPSSPPTSADIDLLQTGGRIFIGHSELGANDESPYKWVYFNVASTEFKVTANTKYGIILRIEDTGGTFNYFTIGKKTSDANNRVISYPGGITEAADITTITSGTWAMTGPTTAPGAMVGYVEIKKTRQELKSIDIIDVLNPNISSGFTSDESDDDTTIRVRSDDFSKEYDRGATDDYLIEYSGGKFWINFEIAGSEIFQYIQNVVILTWLESKTDLLEITDLDHIIDEKSEFGDHTTYLSTVVNGSKLSPADAPAQINKIFDLYPGILLGLESENHHQKKAEVVKMYDWKDSLKKFQLTEDALSSEFVFEFKDPFVIGTTGYVVEYGKGKSTDNVLDGATSALVYHNVPLFYQVLTGSIFDDDKYRVMLHPYHYKEWRLATAEDYADMAGNCIGAEPSSATDVKTKDQFYLKHMNEAFGIDIVWFTAYETEEISYYVDENGVILEDDSYIGSGDKNPLPTSYPSKRIYVQLSPVDAFGSPMFQYHAVSGKDGYDADAYYKLEQYHACKVDRADIYSKGIDVIYSNFGVLYKRFLRIQVTGFPINKQTDLKDGRRRTGHEHADAKHLVINNNLIQSMPIVTRMSMILDDFWGKERIRFYKDVVYDPRFRPGAVVKVTSELEGLENHLFYITSPKHSLSLSSGMKTSLGNFLQV